MEIPIHGAVLPAGSSRARGEGRGGVRTWQARLAAVLACALSAAAGFALAFHYPIGPSIVPMAVFGLVALGAFAWPHAWLVAMPAAIPLIGFAPWTGWITFEELDLLALAIAAGGYARLAGPRRPALEKGERAVVDAPVPLLTWLLMVAYAVSIAVSLVRGQADAGGFQFAWFDGYQGSMNSVRLGKSFFLVLLLLPLWRDAHRAAPAATSARWTAGWCAGLAAVSLAALWERLAYTGLLDFSSDYRTTALFWEMNVGGAAFDGFLALTVPFALRELLTARKAWRSMVALGVLVLASYACLTTFSRGVFLAIPVGVAATSWLGFRQQRQMPGGARAKTAPLWAAAFFAAAYLAAAFWMFPSSGYRGLLALLGALALVLRLGGAPFKVGKGRWLSSLLLGVSVASLALWMAWWLPKGAYVASGAICVIALGASAAPRTRWIAVAAVPAVIVSIGTVCLHWGGEVALARAVPVMVALLALLFVGQVRGRQVWPGSLRWQGAVLGGLVASSVLVGVLVGGAYMSDRVSTSEDDLQTRIDHWVEGLGMLRGPAEWAFGMGLGRYPANFYLLHSGTDAPGDYALLGPPGQQHLELAGGKHMIGWGELLRVSQRVRPPTQPVIVRLKVKTDQASGLSLEVCEKQLLYNGACLLKGIGLTPTDGSWKSIETPLDGAVSRGAWYAPKLLSFSIGNGATGTRFEVADIELIDADGTDLLVNGDFSHGMARWFFSSDHNHLPWHLKNIFVHVLFDQGGFGLAVLVAMLAGGFWRLVMGSGRHHPLAPALAGALLGFLVVGLFDSLLDVPRDAFVFYFLLLQGLTLRGPRSA